jgi:hypothetical protein
MTAWLQQDVVVDENTGTADLHESIYPVQQQQSHVNHKSLKHNKIYLQQR